VAFAAARNLAVAKKLLLMPVCTAIEHHSKFRLVVRLLQSRVLAATQHFQQAFAGATP